MGSGPEHILKGRREKLNESVRVGAAAIAEREGRRNYVEKRKPTEPRTKKRTSLKGRPHVLKIACQKIMTK